MLFLKQEKKKFFGVTHPTDPELTRKGSGVGHWLWGELARELLVLDTWLWGHWGGPTAMAPGPRLLDQHSNVLAAPFSSVAGNQKPPVEITRFMSLHGDAFLPKVQRNKRRDE